MAEILIKHGSYSHYTTKLIVNQTSQSVANNTSTLSWSFRTDYVGTSGAWNSVAESPFTAIINGTTVTNQNHAYDFRSSKSKVWASGTLTVTHNADGTKTVPFSFSFNGNNAYFGSGNQSGSMTLTTIPRATTPLLNTNNVNVGSAVTISLNRASSSFTHNLFYRVGSSGTLNAIATGVGTSHSWTVPATISSLMTNKKSESFQIVCETRNGTTVIGTRTVGITINLVASTMSVSPTSLTMGGNVTITTSKKFNNATQRVFWRFGSGSYNTISTNAPTTETWATTVNLASNIPNNTSGTFTIVNETWNGSVHIGTVTQNITLTVPATVVPNLTQTVTGVNLVNGAYIQSHSQTKVKITDSGSYGSTIQSRSTVIKFGTTTFQTSNAAEFTSGVLQNAGTYTVQSTVTDSRGRSTTKSFNIQVAAYSTPKLTNAKAHRSTSTGAVSDTDNFAALGGTVTFATSGNINGAFKVEYRQSGSSTWTQVFNQTGISGTLTKQQTVSASAESEWEVRMTLSDGVKSPVIHNFRISSDKATVDYHHSGNGIAIGKVASEEWVFRISEDWNKIGGACPIIPANKNLNEVTDNGVHFQNLNANASLTLNYPLAKAGYLEVFTEKSKYSMIQRYTDFEAQTVWMRHRYNNYWSKWKLIRGCIGLTTADITTPNASLSITNLWMHRSASHITVSFNCKPTQIGWAQAFGFNDSMLRARSFFVGSSIGTGSVNDTGVGIYVQSDGIIRVVTHKVPTYAVPCTITYPLYD